ncbi:MAG: ATP-binding protein, partial [Lachnospiraceae bacterium]|nr:ATP-binding protein [Lachnospiraceae bacterium]
MTEIHILDQLTIDKIAAGEVVERPLNVVKELMENAIDANATSLSVEIRDGGTSLIRITDNGAGIDKEQIQKAFYRHSTSKISSADDLSFVTSLGFRGEALSSIAAVSKVELCTKTKDSMTGTIYKISGGKEISMEDAGLP